jgi:predicted RNA-binding protein associated with RNAse of E/G family
MSIEVRFTKWGGKRHWHYRLEPLGTDQYGCWLGGRAGIQIQRGDEQPMVQPHDFVALVPADGRWIANWNDSAATDTTVYVDVTTTPVLLPGAVEAVDLDLDVIRLRDGTVRVLDEDEFDEHQRLYGYPAEVIAQAEATTAELVARVTAGAEPFGEVGRARLAGFIGAA